MSESNLILRTISVLLEGIVFRLHKNQQKEVPDDLLDFGASVEYLRKKSGDCSTRLESLAIVLKYRHCLSHVNSLPSILELSNAIIILKKWFVVLNPKNYLHQQVENVILLSVELLETLLDREINTVNNNLVYNIGITSKIGAYINNNMQHKIKNENLSQIQITNIDEEKLEFVPNEEKLEFVPNEEKLEFVPNEEKYENAPRSLKELKTSEWSKKIRNRKILVISGKHTNTKLLFVEWDGNIANCWYKDPFIKNNKKIELSIEADVLIFKLNYKDKSINKEKIYEYEEAPLTFRALRDTEWKEKLRQRKILIVTGKHKDSIYKFTYWSGTVAYCMYNDTSKKEYIKIGLPIDTNIKIIKLKNTSC